MNHSENMNDIGTAWAEAQGELTNIVKNKSVKVAPKDKTKRGYSYNYAPLDEVINHAKPILKKYGLSYIQSIEQAKNQCVGVKTMILHSSGQFFESGLLEMPVHVEQFKSQAQGVGIAMTYARRYQLSAMLGIAGEEDTDGAQDPSNPYYHNAPKSKVLSKNVIDAFYVMALQKGITKEKIDQRIGDKFAMDISQLTTEDFQKIRYSIEEMEDKK